LILSKKTIIVISQCFGNNQAKKDSFIIFLERN